MKTEAFNNMPEAERKQALENLHSIARVFSTDEGKKLVEHWRKKYVESRYSAPDKTNDERMFNAGKADFVLDIVKAIEISQKV